MDSNEIVRIIDAIHRDRNIDKEIVFKAIEAALVSAAKRTLQTWQAAALAFPQVKVEVLPSLYGAGIEQLEALGEQKAKVASTLMIVGHNPGLHEFALSLLGRAAIDQNPLAGAFPTAAAAVFRMDGAGGPRYRQTRSG